MPKRKARKAVEKAANSASEFKDEEVERQIAATRALRDIQIEQLRTKLRLLRSCITDEQVPVLQYFKENHPDLFIVRNERDRHYEVQWKDSDGNLSMDLADARDVHSTLLHRLSMAYPDPSAAMPSFGGFEFSNKSVKSSLFGVENLQIRGLSLEEPSASRPFEMQDSLQTPGANNHRLSVGMTPKTVRLPKAGEMLLSVHGSPLGVFKEENMEAIQESEDD